MSNDVRVSEWDGTPWQGEAKIIEPSRPRIYLPSSISPHTIKAVTNLGPWATGIPLTSLYDTPQRRAAAALKAYKVGWFYKAEHKIAEDIAALKVSVAPEDTEGDNETTVVEPDLFTDWERLDPIGQFLRLMERPNPNQTGRALRAKTQIRVDMAGWGFWYLENGANGGLPTAIYGISPSRMWASHDNAGNLIGWVMDKDSPGKAVPFEADEILTFATSSPDDGDPFGVGIFEAIASELPLGELMARHVSDLLTTGGRLAGMLWPKDKSLSEAEFQDAQRAWRNVASDPNAARRLLLFPEPMEWTAGASTPAQIGIPDLANLNRDNILTAFPISPYMLGIPIPGGMNASGEVRREERLAYQQDTIHPRVELLEEAVQVGLLNRYEAIMGATYDFEIAEPNLDTAPALVEKVGALTALWNAGFDEKEAVAAVGLDHIKFLGRPAPAPALPAAPEVSTGLVVNAEGNTARTTNLPVTQALVKAEIEDQKNALVRTAEGTARSVLSEFFRAQFERVAERLRNGWPKAKAARKANPPDFWDDSEDDELRFALQGFYVEIGRDGLQAVANNLNKIVAKPQVRAVIEDLLAYGGQRISDINAKTLQSLTLTLAEGTRRGYSLNQIIEGVPDENYPGVKGTTLDNGTEAFSDYRAEMIARTETALSYNRAAVTGYGAYGVEQLEAYDGDGDPECAERAGQVYSIEEALGIEDHPNGTLVWSPVIEDKSMHDDDRMLMLATKAIEALSVQRAQEPMPIMSALAQVVNDEQTKAQQERDRLAAILETLTAQTPIIQVNVPAQPAPVVNVQQAVIPAPVVNVNPTLSEMTVNMPAKDKRVVYDRQGRIVKLEVVNG